MADRIKVLSVKFDPQTNRTYVRVSTPEFTETYDVSGRVSKSRALRTVRPVIEQRLAEFSHNPAKFDRCIQDVTRSLKKYHRPGNAYAICSASGIRRNLVLDPYTVTLLPGTMRAIEHERQKLARAASRPNARKVGVTMRQTHTTARGQVMLAGHRYYVSRADANELERRGLVTGMKYKSHRERRNAAKRNPVDAAQDRYEKFHGRPSEELVRITTPIHEHKYVAGLGELRKLTVLAPDGHRVTISNFGSNHAGQPAILSMNEEATQLFIDGGDQSVDLADFGIFEPYHETETLGRVRDVYYFTTKDHLGPRDGGTATYHHRFGGIRVVILPNGKKKKKRSPYPDLIYDTRNKLLHFSGGGYTLPDEGIEN